MRRYVQRHALGERLPHPLVDELVAIWLPGWDEESSRNAIAWAWSVIDQKQAANRDTKEVRIVESN